MAAVEQPIQNQETDETPILSPRTTSRWLLSLETSIEGLQTTMQEVVLQRLETLARPQIMHKNVKNSFEIGDSKALVGLEYIKLGKIIKKCKKEGDQSKITKNPM